MRSRLTPDGEKLVITTTEGYIIIIHDLDLSTLSQDLSGFKPSLYRVMQTRGSPLAQACKYNSLFTRKTNRVELISDFPPWNDAEMIASLDVRHLYSFFKNSLADWLSVYNVMQSTIV